MFSEKLISWYHQNKRELPWRNTRDPYKIWLSEIILQQTRVEQGLPYYQKFIAAFPTVVSLAKAKEDEVLKLWQGLGYYSRARNLQHAAKSVATDFKGKFPSEYKDILSLKGVGEYTAAAIASFSYDLPYPVLDGNVFRVISRVYGFHEAIDSSIGKKKFIEHLHTLIPHKDPASFNQAIMEFGAMHCTPKNPDCNACIFKSECYAANNDKVDLLPVKEKKIVKRDRYFYYKVSLDSEKNILIQKRKGKDIWEGMYEFPNVESPVQLDNPLKELNINKKELLSFSEIQKHLLTHQNIYFSFYVVKAISSKKDLWVSAEKLLEYPVPKIIQDFIHKTLNLYLPHK
ncbi:MAG: A/G-specific adenine glycosylase [Bacteroidetes bacterium]|nr:A/G-specific adenine glycosylase [Bacteroidota bacterium]